MQIQKSCIKGSVLLSTGMVRIWAGGQNLTSRVGSSATLPHSSHMPCNPVLAECGKSWFRAQSCDNHRTSCIPMCASYNAENLFFIRCFPRFLGGKGLLSKHQKRLEQILRDWYIFTTGNQWLNRVSVFFRYDQSPFRTMSSLSCNLYFQKGATFPISQLSAQGKISDMLR